MCASISAPPSNKSPISILYCNRDYDEDEDDDDEDDDDDFNDDDTRGVR